MMKMEINKDKKFYCRNCGILILTMHHMQLSEDDSLEDYEYCSEYCFTEVEAPENLEYFKKPKWRT